MASSPVTSVFSSKSDVAYHELRRHILTGSLEAGSRLQQYELAAQMGMSITPLREAIRRLSSEGLLDVDTHRDVRVACVSVREAQQLLEVRLALEPSAVSLAARHRTAADVAAMRDAAARLLPVTRAWGEDALIAHREFHRALYVGSHNDVMIKLLDDLWDKSDRYRRLGLDLPPGDEPRTADLDDHHRILDLVIAEDGEAAAELTRIHIERSLGAQAIDALRQRDLSTR